MSEFVGFGVPDDRVRTAMRLLVDGHGQRSAAAMAGIGLRTLQRRVADAGGMPPRRCENEGRYQLSRDDREEVRAGLERGESLRAIAAMLGRPPSTISREVNRNGGREHYRAWKADERAHREARRPKLSWFEACPAAWERVQELLRTKKWSPEQISGRLRLEFPDQPEVWVSPETIYRSIYVQAKAILRTELAACLRTGRARRRPRNRASVARTGKIRDMVMISDRPAEIEDRAVPGHWEGDLIIGANGRSAVATLVERSTRFGLLIALENKTAEHVAARIAEHIATLSDQLLQSITWDQGKEMASHAAFSVATGIPVYFCDPHSPWQRGTNENWNGLARQFLPKGTNLAIHSQDDLDHISALLNGRPRKTLGFHTPAERLNQLLLH